MKNKDLFIDWLAFWNGFFIGIPVKITVDNDDAVKKYVEFLDAYNNQDDQNSELSKICSMFGRGYEMYYVDEMGNIGIIQLIPILLKSS